MQRAFAGLVSRIAHANPAVTAAMLVDAEGHVRSSGVVAPELVRAAVALVEGEVRPFLSGRAHLRGAARVRDGLAFLVQVRHRLREHGERFLVAGPRENRQRTFLCVGRARRVLVLERVHDGGGLGRGTRVQHRLTDDVDGQDDQDELH